MKRILLFESFDTKSISKTLNYLKDDNKKTFLNSLKRMIINFDIPIDKISDDYLHYMNKNDALEVRNENKVENKYGIYCIKFWFDIDGDFIGTSCVGNNTDDGISNISNAENIFNNRQIEELNRNGFEGGYLDEVKPTINSYLNLKTGDKVVGVFGDNLCPATIFNERNTIYALQNYSDGGTPQDSSYRNYGYRYSWQLSEVNSIYDDHDRLHRIVNIELEENSIFKYNLPIDYNGKVSRWNHNFALMDKINNCDFAFVFYLNDFINNNQKVSDKTIMRFNNKEGATKLISDHEIKYGNIKRYNSLKSN
jgi:hypothetical protein